VKIAVVLGTRPEIIKMASIIKELERRNIDFLITHTGQHYAYDLDRVFFEQLRLPHAKYNLEVGSGSHAEQTAKILTGVEGILQEEHPTAVLVEGDTNSVLGTALAASKLQIKIGHVESGLRSYNKQMPEEINRILTDHCSDYLFSPTKKAKGILLAEGIPEEKIFMTGNTIVDAVYQYLNVARKHSDSLHSLHLNPREYFLVTIHRQENVDNEARFASIVSALEQLAREFHLPVIFPIHPHSKKQINYFGLRLRNIRLIEPVGFLEFLQLEDNARLILTDSGGVQEESCILGVPCVTLRDDTERPETLEVGSNILAGTEPEKILECSQIMFNKKNKWPNPFGDGKTAERIVSIIMRNYR